MENVEASKKQSYYETMQRYNKEINDEFYLISIKCIGLDDIQLLNEYINRLNSNYIKLEKFVKYFKNNYDIKAEDHIISNLLKNKQLIAFLTNKIHNL